MVVLLRDPNNIRLMDRSVVQHKKDVGVADQHEVEQLFHVADENVPVDGSVEEAAVFDSGVADCTNATQ